MEVVELFFTCLTLTFLNRSGNPATGTWQHLEYKQCMFSSELCLNYDRDTKANSKSKPTPISEGRMSMIGRAYVCKGLCL